MCVSTIKRDYNIISKIIHDTVSFAQLMLKPHLQVSRSKALVFCSVLLVINAWHSSEKNDTDNTRSGNISGWYLLQLHKIFSRDISDNSACFSFILITDLNKY